MLKPAEIDTLIRRIAERMQPERIIMFGSYAKGTATNTSDLDLLVVKKTDVPLRHRTDDLEPLLARMLIHVDVHVYTPEEVEALGSEPGSFVDSILRSGKTLHGE